MSENIDIHAPAFARSRTAGASTAMELRGQCPSHIVASHQREMRCYFRSRWIDARARTYPSLIRAFSILAASPSSSLRFASSAAHAMCLTTSLSAARSASSAPIASIITFMSALQRIGGVGGVILLRAVAGATFSKRVKE